MSTIKKTVAILATAAICLSGCASVAVTEPTIPENLPVSTTATTVPATEEQSQVTDLTAKLSEIENAWYVTTGVALGAWCETQDEQSVDGVRYYGDFNGYDIFFRPNGDDAVTQLLVDDVQFEHRIGFQIYAYREGNFITLQELYARGGLSKMNLLSLRLAHSRFESHDGPVISTFDGIQNTTDAELLMKQAFLSIYDEKGEHSLSELSVTFYGTYGEAHVGVIHGIFMYTQVISTERIAGLLFRYNTGQRIQVYHNGELMPLAEAYDRGVLTQEDIATIHGKFMPKDPSFATE